MDENKSTSSAPEEQGPDEKNIKKRKHHLIKWPWLRIPLKVIMWLIIVILLIPVALYIPPVQTFVKNVACSIVSKSTGMDIEIGRFRLGFPLDVRLDDVLVLDDHKDTMVSARQAIVNVKAMPLLGLDVQLKRLRLLDGYYRMMLPDSSMTLGVRAGMLEVDDKSSANIRTGEITLNDAVLENGNLSLYMDVWKKVDTPSDTTSSTPFKIVANRLSLNNFTFGMSMLPTIDTLSLRMDKVVMSDALIDLGKNLVTWKSVKVSGGDAVYLTPTAEYLATHPAPESTSSDSAPMIIKGDTIDLVNFRALYAVDQAKPMPGFDPSYIEVKDVDITMRNFYNESSTVRLPISGIRASERSGLQIVDGSGLIAIDSIGLKLGDLTINTPYSHLAATADVPFALMQMQPDAPMTVTASGRIGMPDIETFMPDLKTYTSMIGSRRPLDFTLDADGSLSSLKIDDLQAAIPGALSITADGTVSDVLDVKKLGADITFAGDLADPKLVDKFTGMNSIAIPAFKIKGTATVRNENYGADFRLLSSVGDVAAKGHVGLNSERYEADVDINNVNVAYFVPDAGVGHVTATLNATGSGFDPTTGHAHADATIAVKSLEYNKHKLSDIRLHALVDGSNLDLYGISANPGARFILEGTGTVAPDDYVADVRLQLQDIDLQTLGVSETMNSGSGIITLKGSASPAKWTYNIDLGVRDLAWSLPDQLISLPDGLDAHLECDSHYTTFEVNSYLTSLKFSAGTSLEHLIQAGQLLSEEVSRQLKDRSVAVNNINDQLPPFYLAVKASGRGMLAQFLEPSGMSIDTIYGYVGKDSLITGRLNLRRLRTSSLGLDTISLILRERRELLDYKLHIGNRPGTFDEFAQVNVNGYAGLNRLALSLTQQNIKKQTGYRIGLTAAVQDSVVTVHFTPLKSTIAYMPWTFNDDNYIDYNLFNRKIHADFSAASAESSILVRTEPTTTPGLDQLHLNLTNIKVQDFLKMSMTAPPVTATVNSDLNVIYDGRSLSGGGDVNVHDFIYDRQRIGNFDLEVGAAMQGSNEAHVNASLKVNGRKALTAFAALSTDSVGFEPDSLGLSLIRFPLSVANPFIGDMAVLKGSLNGDMRLDGTFTQPVINGYLAFDSVGVNIPMLGANLKFDTVPVTVTDNLIRFDKFDIWGANKNPLTIDGNVDARKLSDIKLDMGLHAGNFQLIGSNKKGNADMYGKLFLDLDADANGSLSHFDIHANLNVLGNTDVTYVLNMEPAQLTNTSSGDVVKFVNFADTLQVAKADTVGQSMAMRIYAKAAIQPGTKVTVDLSSNGTDKVQLQPTANLSYYQNFMGDMTLNGTVTLGEGFARYKVPVLGEKMFTFNPSSTINWTGNIMNPGLNVTAVDEMKANVTSSGNSRLVNFLVTLKATGTLNSPKIAFDLSTNDDLSLQNELSSMSADQRQTQAMNLLLYGQYTGMNTKGNANIGGNMLYGFLESQLNSWAAKTIKGVDLSFGIDQYDKTTDGASSTQTSYSYQVSKTLFNNRFKINVGGNYSTDASADENLEQNLVSDISLEYILRQSATTTMSVRLFRHTGYESILEGEITETGAGFSMKRKLNNMFQLFLFHHKRKKKKEESAPDEPNDSVMRKEEPAAVSVPSDSVARKEGEK